MSFCLRYSVALGDPAQPGREPTENSMNGGHGNYYLLRRVIFGLQSPSSSPCPRGEVTDRRSQSAGLLAMASYSGQRPPSLVESDLEPYARQAINYQQES